MDMLEVRAGTALGSHQGCTRPDEISTAPAGGANWGARGVDRASAMVFDPTAGLNGDIAAQQKNDVAAMGCQAALHSGGETRCMSNLAITDLVNICAASCMFAALDIVV